MCRVLLAAALHEAGRRDNRDAAKRIEHEQIAVASDDQMGTAVDRQLKKFVVSYIAAGGNALGYAATR